MDLTGIEPVASAVREQRSLAAVDFSTTTTELQAHFLL